VLVDTPTSLHEDGFAFIRRLRSAWNGTPLVALTGSHCDDRVPTFGLGADDAIAQPVDRDELRARITAVIRRALPTRHLKTARAYASSVARWRSDRLAGLRNHI